MPSQEQIHAQFADIVNDVTGMPTEDVELGKRFSEDLKIDSLSMVEIIYACEDTFGITIPDETSKSLKTVQEAVDMIADLLPAKA